MSIASNYALRLPAALERELERVAREDGTSLNHLIVTAVAEKLSALRTADSLRRTPRPPSCAANGPKCRVTGIGFEENYASGVGGNRHCVL